jgi:cobalt/nickel transport system permease protein
MHSLWAVHIADGFLSWPWLLTGAAGTVLLVTGSLLIDWLRKRAGVEVRDEEIVQTALLTAAFFVASQVHVRLGPTSVHLLLTGLLGVSLRWRAPLAILAGLLLQLALFGHGGLTTLGINACVLTVPALAAWLLFTALTRGPWTRRPWFHSDLVAAAVFVWLLTVVYSVVLLLTNRFSLSVDLDPVAANYFTFHPLTLAAVLAAALAAAWAERKLDHPRGFAEGLLVGVLTVLLTMGLSCLVLVYGGDAPWGGVVLLTFVAHTPVAAIEGVVLGFTVGFLARVKPSLVGLVGPMGPTQEAVARGLPPTANGAVTPSAGTPLPATPPTAPGPR